MKRMAFGLICPEGFEPALSASTASPPWMCAKASAIWLRLEFSTQTNNTRFMEISSVRQKSAAAGRRRAAGRALVHFRLHRAHVGAATCAIRGAGAVGCVIRGRFTDRVEGFPARTLRVFGPQLVGLRVATDRRFFRHQAAARGIEAMAELGQLVAGFGLDSQVVDAGGAAL